jgi:hypothetical protein
MSIDLMPGFGAFTQASSGGLWLPTNDGLVGLWYDAADASTITVSTGVSEWRDKSGNARHLSQATGANQPAWNSVDTITTDGTNDVLVTSAFSINSVVQSNLAGSIAFVATYTSGIIDMAWNASGNEERIGFEAASRVDWPNDTGGKLESWSESLTGTFKLCAVRRTTTDIYVRLNGTQVATKSDSTTFTSGTNNGEFYVGSGKYGASFSAAIAVKGIVLSGSSDLATFERIEGYLAWEYGLEGALDASHPYKSAAPTV